MKGAITMTLDEAWAAAEAALPEYWFIRSMILVDPYKNPMWEVVAAESRHHVRATGPTPTAALQALAARLQEKSA
jgi:hypothetical protein